ncbi:MAG TPA: YdcF family protein [Polyangiaceae bacterium]|nr:YdcF family protein [Polyangiaceae bacterium]
MSIDAIVVLGCRIAQGGRPRGAALRRVRGAAEAYRRGVAPWVVASGGKCWHGVAEADAFRAELLAAQVPDDRVLTELVSMTTRGNADHVAELFAARQWRCAALVTCDWHLPRAERCFRDAGIECVPVPVVSPEVSRIHRVLRGLRERASYRLDRGSRFGG